ncbi:Hypothetical predicted protein [Mytilus galloprovincialis]|uniref:Endonuclease/exonuclease/phosphatase domain-containing protein n=1 Tax=Mytilus galloprovincialis TaxID=29158 RepID=A0A8B6DDR4_MYTGA|nr:Hypothetical predicted protein [Mytilus galloprovincialis]
MSSIKLVAWNVRGIMSSTICLSKFLKDTDCDICVISEHKLKERSLHYLSTIERGYNCISKADALPIGYNAYHGKGGIAILYKTSLQFSVNEISDINSSRIAGIELKNQSYGSLFIFGAYLPSDDSIENYKSELNILDNLYTYYSVYGNCIIAGDLNASCLDKDRPMSNNYKSKELLKFVSRHHLLYAGGEIQIKGPNYSYITKQTMLDYILCNESMYRKLRYYEILDEGEISSTSDHLPVVAEFVIDSNPHRVMNSCDKLPAWHKVSDAQINEYKKLLNDPVDMLIDKMRSFSYVDIDAINDEFVNILHTAADIAIPKCGFNPHTKPYWNADVKRAHDNERSKRRCWVLEGRPRGMHFDSYRMYKRAKSEFRRVQQVANEQYIQSCYDDLNETAECDVRLFWKQIKRFKGRSSKVYPEIVYENKVCNTPESVANCFAEYFHDIYQPKDENNFDNDFKCSIESTYNEIIKTCGVEGEYLPGGLITEKEVTELIGQLKYRKAAGHDRVQNEHLRHGGISVVKCVTAIFNIIVKQGRIPQNWKLGLLVPIFKGGTKCKTSPDNYRPVSLLSCVLKLFESVIKARKDFKSTLVA